MNMMIEPRQEIIAHVTWVRRMQGAFFSSPLQSVMTLIAGGLFLFVFKGMFDFVFLDAAFRGDADDCHVVSGACWPFFYAKSGQMLYGFYPREELWRIHIITGVSLFLGGGFFWLRRYRFFIVLLLLYPFVLVFLLYGGFGLRVVHTEYWGGLTLTLLLCSAGITLALPLGILLALGKQARKFIVVRYFCIAFIEFFRSVPLITVFFAATFLVPAFLPPGIDIDKLTRCFWGLVLFYSAYMAEVIKGGIYSVERGQREAGKAFSLGFVPQMLLVVLPQALRNSLPGIVNTFLAIIKDTPLLYVVSFLDVFGMMLLSLRDPEWLTHNVKLTGYFVVGIIFWSICYGVSFLSKRIEHHQRKQS